MNAFGYGALQDAVGTNNNAFGFDALFTATGTENSAFGVNALRINTSGNSNVAIGNYALSGNTTGTNNLGIGNGAGSALVNTNDNIMIGNSGLATDANTIRIGGSGGGHNKVFIDGISTAGVAGSAVLVDSNGQLGVTLSSRRYKQDIEDMGDVSSRLLNLRTVTFRYKNSAEDSEPPLQFGLIAEEVAEVMPEIVVYDDEGRPETVKYHLLSSLLLNEFQKLHQVNQEQDERLTQIKSQEDEISELRAQIAVLQELTSQLLALEPSGINPIVVANAEPTNR